MPLRINESYGTGTIKKRLQCPLKIITELASRPVLAIYFGYIPCWYVRLSFSGKGFYPGKKCETCWRPFQSHSAYINHRAMHRGQTKCPVCLKVFSNKSNLKKHLGLVHSQGRVEQWDQCGNEWWCFRAYCTGICETLAVFTACTVGLHSLKARKKYSHSSRNIQT